MVGVLLKSEGRPSGVCEEGKGTKKESRFLMLRNEKIMFLLIKMGMIVECAKGIRTFTLDMVQMNHEIGIIWFS